MPTYKDPVELFHAATAAMQKEDWAGTAALCDPVSLSVFQRELVAQMSPPRTRRTLTVEDMLRNEPDMPRVAAEYQIAKMQKYNDPTALLRQELPGVESVEELRKLDPASAFARFLAGESPTQQLERLIAQGRVPARAVESIRATAKTFVRPPELVGTLPDGENLTHIFYRSPLQGDNPQWLADVPADERGYRQDLFGREVLKSVIGRRQPDGGWLLVAGRSFLMSGKLAGISFGPSDEEQEGEIEDELSP